MTPGSKFSCILILFSLWFFLLILLLIGVTLCSWLTSILYHWIFQPPIFCFNSSVLGLFVLFLVLVFSALLFYIFLLTFFPPFCRARLGSLDLLLS